MKLKIFLVALISIVILMIVGQKLFVDHSTKQMVTTMQERVTLESALFSHFVQLDANQNINITEDFARDSNFIKAFDAVAWNANRALPTDTPEMAQTKKAEQKKIYNNIQVELNTINKLYDKSDILFLTDLSGNIIVKNLDGAFSGVSLASDPIIKTALKGQGNVDVLKIKGKNYIVTAVPFKNAEGIIIGAYCSGDEINSTMIKEYSTHLDVGSQLHSTLTPIFFAIIEKETLLGSNLPPEYHTALRQALPSHAAEIQVAIKDARSYPLTVTLKDEQLYTVISTSKQLKGNKNIVLLTLSSSDKILDSLEARQHTFLIIALLIAVFAFIFSFLIDESVQKPITRFTEGMLEIINGNTRYRFNNDVTGLEEMLNQNANMMISVLQKEKTPEQ
ncbi:hypothetical protein KAH37_05765 [bacterium]|nr:hypothetical protein [bacterium]